MNGVWITGLGAVTAVGREPESMREALVSGRSGVRPRPRLGGYPAGEVTSAGDEPEDGARRRNPDDRRDRRLERGAALFRQAAERAWRGAGLTGFPVDPTRVGVCDGSSVGPIGEVARRAAERDDRNRIRVRPSAIIQLMPGAGGAAFAQQVGAQGPVLHVNAGSVAAAAAIGEAALWVESGRVDVAVAGGAESPLQEEVLAHFRAAGILPDAPDLESPCRPFDASRRGTVFGEGAGALVLESADHARRRGADALAALRGYGLTAEQHGMVAPDPTGTGVCRAARQALRGSTELAWIKAHGSGTRAGDKAELRGLDALLGADLADMAVTGLKPTVGHCLGASAAVEVVLAVLAWRETIVPPTVGTSALDPALPRCDLVTETRAARRGDVLLLAEGFGGRCGALRIGRAARRVAR